MLKVALSPPSLSPCLFIPLSSVLLCQTCVQASLELEQERTRSLQQEVGLLKHDLDSARATEAVVERQRQEHAKMAADSFGK